MNKPTLSAIRKLSTLTSDQKTAVIDAIAGDMTTTMIRISQEINRGNLDPDNTAPMHNFIGTLQRHERAELGKLERKIAKYQRRARMWRAERRLIRDIVAEMKRHTGSLHQCPETLAKALESLEKGLCSESGSGSGESSSGQ